MTRLHFSANQQHWIFYFAMVTTLCALASVVMSAYATILGPEGSRFWIGSYQLICLVMTIFSLGILTISSLMTTRYFSLAPFLICLLIYPFLGTEIVIIYSLNATGDAPIAFIQALLQLIVVSLLWWICKITWPDSYPHTDSSLKTLRPFAWVALILLWLEVIFSLVLNFHAATNPCGIFPYCSKELAAFFQFKKTFLVFFHAENLPNTLNLYFEFYRKLIEIIAFLYLGIFSFIMVFNRFIFQSAFCIFMLLALQIWLGILNVNAHNHVAILLAHAIVACLLLLAVTNLLINVHHKPRDLWHE